MRALFDMASLTVVLCRDSVRSLLKSVKAAINSVVLSYLSARSFSAPPRLIVSGYFFLRIHLGICTAR